jgi:hypothetical protein
VPAESNLTEELKTYIKTILAMKSSTKMEQLESIPEPIRALLTLSVAGPYRFIRAPYSSMIEAQFLVAESDPESGGTDCDGLVFVRGEQGWRLDGGHYVIPIQTEPVSRRKSEISRIVGKAIMQKSTPVVLRQDGTWDSEDSPDSRSGTNSASTGYDLNGSELTFAIDDNGRRTWRRLDNKALPVHIEAVSSELKQALDHYIESLSSGNVQEFLANGGAGNKEFESYHSLKYCENQSKGADSFCDGVNELLENCENEAKANPDSLCNPIKSKYGETNLKTLLKELLERAIQQVDIPSAVQELKRLRSATPRISPIVFSPDFEALYTLPPKEASESQTVKRLTGHGSTWTFDNQ